LLNPQDNLWDVEFPCLTGSENAVARALLQCWRCQRQEVIHFNEIEFEVFDSNQSIQRFCNSCSARTLWKHDSQEPRGDRLASLGETSPKMSSTVQSRQNQSRRKDTRLPANVSACISQPGFREEIVRCEDVSRGGLCFTSRKNYLERSRVEISVPYLQKNGNIFQPARIVYVHPLGPNLFRHGVAYIRA
jgi:PilZ domain